MTAAPDALGLLVALLPDAGRTVLVQAAVEVLRGKEPPEMPAWLRRLRGFEPRRLRSGQAARDLLRGVSEAGDFGAAVVAVLREAHPELAASLEENGPGAIDAWLSDGGEAGVLAAVALTAPPALAAYVIGRATAATMPGPRVGEAGVDERRAAEKKAADKQREAKVARARAAEEKADRARLDAEKKLETARAEARKLRAAAADERAAKAEAVAAVSAKTEAEDALARARADLDAVKKDKRELERRVVRAESRLAQLEKEAETGDGLAAVAGAADTLEKAAAALRRLVPPATGVKSGPAPAKPTARPKVGGDQRPRPAIRAGLNPDSSDGLVSMLRRGLLFLVDGYNVAYHRDGIPDRDALVQGLAALVRRTGATCVVYFDGVETSRRRRSGIEVAFTAEDVEADDAILSDLARAPVRQPVVVASSDRRVAAGAENAGAEVVSSAALLAALRVRRG